MQSLTTLTTILVLGLGGVASAQTWRTPANANAPQNRQPQTEARYQPRNQLANVRLEPGSDRAYIQLPASNRPLDYLELRGGRTRFTLDDVEVMFGDGTSIRTGDRGVVEPFEGRVIDLPQHTAPVTAIVAHYRTSGRWPAHLQVFGVREHNARRGYWRNRGYR